MCSNFYLQSAGYYEIINQLFTKEEAVYMQENKNIAENNTDNEKKPFVLTNKWKALILGSIAVVVFFVVIFSPAFSVKEIKIEGSEYYSEEEISAYLDHLMRKNGNVLLLKNTKFSEIGRIFSSHLTVEEEKLIFDFPLIRDAKITYAAPGTINVTLTDRQPVMMVDYYSTFIYVDTQGYVLAVNSEGNTNDLPVVQGIDIDTFKVGSPLTLVSDKKIDAAIKLSLAISELSMNDYIDIIDVSDYNDIRMFCAPSLAIEFGSLDNLKVRLSILKGVFDTGVDGSSNGTIDMTGSNVPVFRENT